MGRFTEGPRLNPLLALFVDIARLRRGPQELPASGFLLQVVIALSLVVGTISLGVDIGHFGNAMLAQSIDLGCFALLLYGSLSLARKLPRFTQVATAWFGCGVLISLLSLPTSVLIAAPEGELLWEIGVLLRLVLLVWSIAIGAHILRHAFDTRFGVGLMMALGYFFLVQALVAGLLVVE